MIELQQYKLLEDDLEPNVDDVNVIGNVPDTKPENEQTVLD